MESGSYFMQKRDESAFRARGFFHSNVPVGVRPDDPSLLGLLSLEPIPSTPIVLAR
jgi:hypothetical protein